MIPGDLCPYLVATNQGSAKRRPPVGEMAYMEGVPTGQQFFAIIFQYREKTADLRQFHKTS